MFLKASNVKTIKLFWKNQKSALGLSPDEIEEGEGGKDDEPEPEEDVDLLVDDVDWKQTLRMMKWKTIVVKNETNNGEPVVF